MQSTANAESTFPSATYTANAGKIVKKFCNLYQQYIGSYYYTEWNRTELLVPWNTYSTEHLKNKLIQLSTLDRVGSLPQLLSGPVGLGS